MSNRRWRDYCDMINFNSVGVAILESWDSHQGLRRKKFVRMVMGCFNVADIISIFLFLLAFDTSAISLSDIFTVCFRNN